MRCLEGPAYLNLVNARVSFTIIITIIIIIIITITITIISSIMTLSSRTTYISFALDFDVHGRRDTGASLTFKQHDAEDSTA